MSHAIDLDFRPATYFRPQALERYLLSKVKGAVFRKNLLALIEEGKHAQVSALLNSRALFPEESKALESIHPSFMGGNYLPDPVDGEVEIARISIKSTTYDVTSVLARPDAGFIRYRVVDEYEGETLEGITEARTGRPMTLGEFAEFFLGAWPLFEVVERNYGHDLAASLDFFVAESAFYPDFDRLCRKRVIARFREAEDAEQDER